jgi:hypothetical protein
MHKSNRHLATISIPPTTGSHGPVKFSCGLFEDTMPEPRFELRVDPSPNSYDAFAATLHRIDFDDHYELIYFFENWDGPEYKVTVKDCGLEAA